MTSAIPKSARIPLPALLGVVEDALWADFQNDLVGAGYGDIRPGHGCVFRFLGDGGMRLTELAGLADMTKQSAGEVIDDLVALGYVERIPDPQDRRAKLIRLTPRGEVAQRIGFSLFGQLEERWAERYGSERLAQLRELLEEITATEAPEAVPELAHQQLANA